MKQLETKKLLKKIKKVFASIGSKINLNTWYFTILFFICILVVSVFVWWQCLQDPFPSNSVLMKIEQGKVNYRDMKTSTEVVIKTLQESKEKFENPPFFGNQRELFLEIDLESLEEVPVVIPIKEDKSLPAEKPTKPVEDVIP